MKKVLITGAKGFIGSCLLDYLVPTEYDIVRYDKLNSLVEYPWLKDLDAVIHLGARSSTNNINTDDVFNNNLLFSIDLINKLPKHCKLIYASSASVYGNQPRHAVTEEKKYENCDSLYSQSKLIFDDIVRTFFADRQFIGLRFFNVCSFNSELHKTQPSPTYTFLNELKVSNTIKLFYGSDNVFRDFIYVEDVIRIIEFFLLQDIERADVFNVGSGIPISFEQVADAMINKFNDFTGSIAKKKYIDRPQNMTTNYQEYTHADISKLRQAGYKSNIPTILDYISDYDGYGY